MSKAGMNFGVCSYISCFGAARFRPAHSCYAGKSCHHSTSLGLSDAYPEPSVHFNEVAQTTQTLLSMAIKLF